jgi:TPR repeat protein
VGQIYENGYAGERNLPKAVSYFKKAGIVGYAPSEYELGVIYYNGGDGVAENKRLAADWLYQAAKRGNANALYALGRIYDLGDALPADPQKAVVYYKEAALKGQPEAQNALGLLFYTGEIVGKDPVVARKWFLQAAKGGNADAMFNLGVMMVNGEGGDKDLVLAYVWFRLAGEMGLKKASAAAKELEARLTPEDRVRADALLKPIPGQ